MQNRPSTRLRDALNCLLLLVFAVLAGTAQAERDNAYDKSSQGELRQKARDEGRVRVIVGLRMAAAPAGESTAARAARENEIGGKQSQLLGRIAHHAPDRVRQFRRNPYMALRVDEAGLAALAADPEVESIEEDIPHYLSLNDTPAITHALDAWNAGYSGAGQAVAILDTGVDRFHGMLAGKVVAEACFGTNSGAVTSQCPNGSSTQTGSGAGAPCSNLSLGCYHGTHVAGIAAGKRGTLSANSGGMAPDAKLIAIQVFSLDCNSQPCRILAYTSDLVAALEHVYGLRNNYAIASANLSLGGGNYASYCDAASPAMSSIIGTLRNAGIATVVASGNDGSASTISHPACISTAVSVGSTTKGLAISSFSNSAAILSILAPGSSITSAYPGGGYVVLSGTSMATPHVAGAFATMKSAKPTASVSEILGALQTYGAPVLDTRNGISRAVFQLGTPFDHLAIDAVVNLLPSAVLTSPANGSVVMPPGSFSLAATASDPDGSVALVEFLANGSPVGSAASPPYAFNWSNVPAGSYQLTARVTDNEGGSAVSAPIGVRVNAPPTSAIAAPAANATFTAPASISVSANAADSDGSVTLVEFFANGNPIGSKTSSPYAINWASVAAGSYSLTARATDNEGASTTSAPVTITVSPPNSGGINVALASNGAVATASSSYSSAYGPAGTINGDRKGLNWASNGGWNDATAGNFPDWLQVNFSGSKTISEIDVFTVQDAYNAPVEPTSTTAFSLYGLTAFDVQYWDGATWVTVPGGAITGNTLVWRKIVFAPVTTDRIRILVNSALNGYSRITEVEAWTSNSPPGNVPPTVALSAPANGASFTDPASISVSANAADSDGSVTLVEFFANGNPIGSKTSSPYAINWASVAAGSYSLTARATDNEGASTTSAAVTITVSPPNSGSINVALASNGGVASASSITSSAYSGAGAIDGDRSGANWGNNGGWRDGTANAFPDWLQVNFNGSKTIGEVDVFSVQDNYSAGIAPTATETFSLWGVTAFDVQYWDGATWVTVPGGAITGNNLVWRKVVFAPVVTDRIRILVNNALAAQSRILEVEAWTSNSPPGNVPPTVALSAPANGASFTDPASISVSANAADSDGSVTLVEFFANGNPIGSKTSSPYAINWASVAAGSYSLTARATDNEGASTTSAPVTITVSPPNSGGINVALASNGAVATASSSYSSAYGPAGTINGDRKGLNWASNGGWNDATAGNFPDWLQVNFSGSKTISEIDVFTVQDAYNAPVEPTSTTAFSLYGLTAFDVQYWDGATWVTVPGGAITGNTLVWRKIVFAPVTTDRIRILVNSALNGYSRITEVEAWTQ